MLKANFVRRDAVTKVTDRASKLVKVDASTRITDVSGKVKTAGKLLKVLMILISLMLGYASANAQFSGGNGDPGNPYLLSNIDDWNDFADYVNNNVGYFNTKHYKLTGDIGSADPTDRVTTMAASTNIFRGSFDGGGFTVWLDINPSITTPNVGLFGCVAGVTIKNLTVAGSVHYSGLANIGGIAGNVVNIVAAGNINSSLFQNCRNFAKITCSSNPSGNSRIGGILGMAGDESSTTGMDYSAPVFFENCTNWADIDGDFCCDVGGITGMIVATDAYFDSCENYGNVYGGKTDGGGFTVWVDPKF